MQFYWAINQILSQREAALLNGILPGLDNDLPISLIQAYQRTGTAHIIAISGFDIRIMLVKNGTIVYLWLFFEKPKYPYPVVIEWNDAKARWSSATVRVASD